MTGSNSIQIAGFRQPSSDPLPPLTTFLPVTFEQLTAYTFGLNYCDFSLTYLINSWQNFFANLRGFSRGLVIFS